MTCTRTQIKNIIQLVYSFLILNQAPLNYLKKGFPNLFTVKDINGYLVYARKYSGVEEKCFALMTLSSREERK